MALEPGLVEPRRAGPPFAVGVLAVLGTLPAVTALEPLAEAPRWLVVVVAITVGIVGVGVAAAVGSVLARDIGFRALATDRLPGTGLRAYRLPAVVGVGVAVVTLGIHAGTVAVGVDPGPPSRWVGDGSFAVVASVASGIVAELVLRFGVMTFVVWTAWTYRPAIDRSVTPTSAWAGVLVAATLGGCMAVPVAIADGVGPAGVAVAAVVPFVGGVVFGLLYWRYDLAAAVVAHVVASLLRALVATI